ncbi:MAG: SoxR reducing system RseC family protein [Spirochaetales bacterium]|nr:SoxR reducing system RseC family protein [Spirochaetales bacterium]
MAKYARILEINNEQVLVGLLNDKGLCGSGSCEGCSCSTKMQTMNVKVPSGYTQKAGLKTGIDVEMKLPKGTALDWFLLIFLPLILVVAAVLLLQNRPESVRNITALTAGLGGFILSAAVLKKLRKDQTIELTPLKSEEIPSQD